MVVREHGYEDGGSYHCKSLSLLLKYDDLIAPLLPLTSPPSLFQGFDEYMNIVLDQAEEVNTKTGAKRAVGEELARNTS